jgi:hypothetical protein
MATISPDDVLHREVLGARCAAQTEGESSVRIVGQVLRPETGRAGRGHAVPRQVAQCGPTLWGARWRPTGVVEAEGVPEDEVRLRDAAMLLHPARQALPRPARGPRLSRAADMIRI